MAFTWRESATGLGQTVVISDPYTLLDWKDVMHSIAERRGDHGPLRLIIDGRDCTPPTAEFIVRALSIMELPALGAAGGRVAIVVTSDAAYGMGRLTEAAVDIRKLPFALRTFRDWTDAERWLGRQDDRTP